MKIILSILLTLASFFSFAQTTAVATLSFNTVTDLKLQVGVNGVQVLVNGLSAFGDQNGGLYIWSDTCVMANNNFTIVQVVGVSTGRWMRVANANTIKGSVTFSATALNSTYVVNHGLPFTPLQVYVQPRSANAAVPSWVSGINSTSFTVNFASVPILGTNNISIDYLIIKQ
jgi:hypothetical protein